MSDEHDNIESSVLPLTDLMVVLIVILSATHVSTQAQRLSAFRDRLSSVQQPSTQLEERQHIITVDEHGCVAIDGKAVTAKIVEPRPEAPNAHRGRGPDNPLFSEDLKLALAPLKGAKAI